MNWFAIVTSGGGIGGAKVHRSLESAAQQIRWHRLRVAAGLEDSTPSAVRVVQCASRRQAYSASIADGLEVVLHG